MKTSDCKSYLGLTVEVVSLLSLATSFLIFKSLVGLEIDFYILYAYAMQTSFFVAYALLRCDVTDVTVNLFGEKFLHLGRAFTGVAGFYSMNVSLKLMPAADTSAIMKTTPVFVTVLAYFFLKERFGIPRVVVLLLTICGVLLICRPTFLFGSSTAAGGEQQSDRLTGTLCGVTASLASSIVYIIQRKIRKTPVIITSLTNALVTFLLLVPPVSARSSWRSVDCGHALMLFVCSACVLVGLLLKFKASRMEEASRLAMVSVVDLPFTLICEIAFFGLEPPWTSYAGSAIITVSVILVILLKRREARMAVVKSARPKVTAASKDGDHGGAQNDTDTFV